MFFSNAEKDRIKEIEVYDDDNEPVTIQENEIVNTEFYELSGDKFRSYIKKEKFTKENWKEFFSIREEHLEYNEYQLEGDLYHLGIYKVHQKKDFCMVFDIVNDDMESREMYLKKEQVHWVGGRINRTEQNFSLQLMMFRVQRQKERLFM